MPRALRSLSGVLLTVVTVSACYQYIPVSTSMSPSPGDGVALVLSDRGRVAMVERAGPEIDQLRGTFVRRTDSSLTVAMSSALSIRGAVTPWAGESLTVSSALLSGVQARQLNRPRTIVLSTVLTSALVAFIATNGFGTGGSRTDTELNTPPGGTGPATVRIPTLLSIRSH